MSNITNQNITINTKQTDPIVTYYSLFVIVTGTILNLLTLIVLCRPAFRDTHKRPTIHYMRAIAIFDIMMLYGWNFDHFLFGAFGFTLQFSSVPLCKICSFWNYFTAQCSAWLRVFICLDRYLSLSRLHKTWFSQSKSVLLIIGGIIIFFFCVHLHFFIFVCYYNPDGTLNPQGYLYPAYPAADYINLILYNCLPFIGMVVLNGGVVYHLCVIRQRSTVQRSGIQHRSINVTLVITTSLFLLMTIPATILFAFFSQTVGYVILHLFDSILYTYHILSFPLYMVTFGEFRYEAVRMLTCNKLQIAPPASLITKSTITR